MSGCLRAGGVGLVLVGCLLTGGCGSPATPPGTATPAGEGESMSTPTAHDPVDLRFVGINPGTPPQLWMLFDITLRNTESTPRWFLLPDELSTTGAGKPGVGGVDGVEVFALSGQGRVVFGRFQGSAACQALLLPAGAVVTIHRFPIQFWEEDIPKAAVPVVVVIARELTVGGEPATAWFGPETTSDAHADVSADARQRLGARHTPDRHEVPFTFVEDRRVSLQVRLVAPGSP